MEKKTKKLQAIVGEQLRDVLIEANNRNVTDVVTILQSNNGDYQLIYFE